MFAGGDSIKEKTVFEDNGTFTQHQPGKFHNWESPQRLKTIQSYFRYNTSHITWRDQEVLQNEVITKGTDTHQYHAFVNLRNEKRGMGETDMWNGLEKAIWASPKVATMEGEGDEVTDIMSIMAWVTENASGTVPIDADGGTWTNVFGLESSTTANNGRWANQTETYSVTTQDNVGNIIAGLEKLCRKVKFERPPSTKDYYENDSLSKQMIVTSSMGQTAYTTLLRGGQDRFVAGPQDPAYNDPMFRGIPVVYSESFENGSYYDDGSSGVAPEATADINGPRFLCLNFNYAFPFFHEERYAEYGKASQHHNVPDTTVVPIQNWCNWMVTSRRRQGILSPSVDLYY